MKKLIFALFSLMMLVASCDKAYNDSALVEKIQALDDRTALYESLCGRVNSNIIAVNGLVAANCNNDRITSIEELYENGVLIGYKISMYYSDAITVYCGLDGKDGTDGTNGNDGKDGADGVVPTVGISTENGVQYWTLNGEYLLDSSGNKIPLVSSSGTATKGITPKLKVEDGDWYYSLDEGSTWTKIEVSVQWGDGNVFSSVSQDNDNVLFTLADGSVITIPKIKSFSLSLSQSGTVTVSTGSSTSISYTITSDDSDVEVEAFGEGYWETSVTKTNATSGTVLVTAPSSAGSGQVVVVATASTGLSMFKILNFVAQ